MKKQSVLNASDVKPNFTSVKDVWKQMLSIYYSDENILKEDLENEENQLLKEKQSKKIKQIKTSFDPDPDYDPKPKPTSFGTSFF